MATRTVHLHIDRLVLRGDAGAPPAELAAALQQALQRELAAPGVFDRLRAAPSRAVLRPGPVAAAPAPLPGAGRADTIAAPAAARLVGGL